MNVNGRTAQYIDVAWLLVNQSPPQLRRGVDSYAVTKNSEARTCQQAVLDLEFSSS